MSMMQSPTWPLSAKEDKELSLMIAHIFKQDLFEMCLPYTSLCYLISDYHLSFHGSSNLL